MALQVCGFTGGNTGIIKCSVSPGKAVTMAIWGGKLTTAEMASQATIKTALLADSRVSKFDSDKLFVLPPIINRENQKEANTEFTFTNGTKVVTREGLPGFRFGFMSSQHQMKQLRKFNDQVVSLIVWDDTMRIWGTLNGDGEFIGRQAKLFFEGLTHVDDASPKGAAYVTVTFLDQVESYDDQYFVDAGFGANNTLSALLDVTLFQKATAVSNVLKISGKIDIGSANTFYDIYEDYADSLESASLWTATNLNTDAAVSIDAVAKNAAGYWDITLDSTEFAAITNGHLVEIALKNPTTLAAANATGIEGVAVVYTKV